MPLDEYQCSKCECVMEFIGRSSNDTKGFCCPHCHGKKPNKMLSLIRHQLGSKGYIFAVFRAG